MATEYNDLDVQAADDVPGATYANQIRANQEALIEPPSTKWRGVAYLNAAWSQSIPATSWARLTMLSVKDGGTQPGASAPTSSYLWQADAGGNVSTGSQVWRDSVNDTSTGTYTNPDVPSETYSRSNAFKVPRNGLYMIGGRCWFIGTGGTDVRHELKIETSGADFQPARDIKTYVGGSSHQVSLQVSTVTYLTTSQYFYLEAYNGASASREVFDVEMWAFRVGRTPT